MHQDNNIRENINTIFLIVGLVILYSTTNSNLSVESFLIFTVTYVFLFFRDSICAFIFAYIYHLNITQSDFFSWAPVVSLIAMFLSLFNYKIPWGLLLKYKPLKSLLLVSIFFALYVLVFNLLNKGTNFMDAVRNIGYYAGFLAFIPAYFLTLYNRESLFKKFTIIAFSFLTIYFISLFLGLQWINVFSGERGGDFEIKRYIYDARQFLVFYTYFIPAVFFINYQQKSTKTALIMVGILAYSIIVFALFRLAMVYVILGAATTFLLVARKISSLSQIISRTSFIVFFGIIILSLLGSVFSEYIKIFQWSLDSFSSNSSDDSANIRFLIQIPLMLEMFFENSFFGAGLQKLLDAAAEGMFGYVDVPILGTLTAFGIIGMLLYYSRFLFILSAGKSYNYVQDKSYILKNKPEYFFILALKAYFITMITYRIFYISWELTSYYMQAEFGLFVGVYFALNHILEDQYCNNEHRLSRSDFQS